MFNWIPETQTALIPLICGGVVVFLIAFIFSLCKVSAAADAHIETIKEELNQEHGTDN